MYLLAAGCVLADDHSHHDHTANLVASPSVASEAVYPSSQGQAAAVDPNLYYNNYQQVQYTHKLQYKDTKISKIFKICNKYTISKLSIISKISKISKISVTFKISIISKRSVISTISLIFTGGSLQRRLL